VGSFIEDDEGPSVKPPGAAGGGEGEPQGWREDPTGRHAERYFSRGLPTKLYRDGRKEGYDDVSAAVPTTEVAKATEVVEGAVCPERLAPPGWYPDTTRTGWARYWDGTSWTSQLMEVAGGEGSGPVAPVASDAGPSVMDPDHPDGPEPEGGPPSCGAVSLRMDLADGLPPASPDSVISMLTEVAGTTAIGSKAGPVAMEHLDIVFLAPLGPGPVVATATPVHIGEGHGVAEVAVKDGAAADELIALATVTVRLLDGSVVEVPT